MGIVSTEVLAMRAESWKRPIDELVAMAAGRQHGVISRAQLLAIGISEAAIGRRLASGRLHALYRGVYAVGNLALPREGPLMAAVIAAGTEATLSHRAAADLLGLWGWNGWPEATVPTFRASRRRLILHTGHLPHDERTLRLGIPLTNASRTIFDFAAVVGERELRSALNEVQALRLRLSPSLPVLLERHPRRAGAAKLRQLLAEDQVGLGITRREFEQAFFAFLVDEGFPSR